MRGLHGFRASTACRLQLENTVTSLCRHGDSLSTRRYAWNVSTVIQQVDAVIAVIPGGGGWVNQFADTLRRRSYGQAHPNESG